MKTTQPLRQNPRSGLLTSAQFWSIAFIFILITLHHYNNLTNYGIFLLPDQELGITRHTIDRILYLIPIILSSIMFGQRGGVVALVLALTAMLPRALFITTSVPTALIETFMVTLIGASAPIWANHNIKQQKHLERAMEKLIGIAVDNSRLFHEKELAGVQLKTSETKYRTLFENTHMAIWVEDLSGKITAANRAASHLFGYGSDELIGAVSQDFLPEDSRAGSEAIKARLLGGEEERLPYLESVIKKDGTTSVIRMTTNLVSTNGHPDGFQFIGRDITNEVRMQENQQFYLRQITKAHEEERLRISRDLHDSTAQDLIAGLHQLEEFCEGQPNMPKEESNFLWALHGQLKDMLHDIRQLSRNLRPSIIDDLGILPAVEWLTEQMTIEDNIETNLAVSGNEHRLAREIEVALFRIVQEALRNVAKHADATEARVSIEFGADETKIAIIDNGKGFEMPDSLGEFSRLGKLGIDGMQTRARLAGGTFDVISGPGKGTTIAVTIPS
ncbi:MAG: hypothetical protein A2074_01910 [Candidatus Aquicultor primus]|uniref:histidine kinase n=1 Tax=Candidatus Aquicultor primus TaxID=1797195 RepID=A0A1F2UMT0_9ACTN|nr:MAG: hypothetical protein A2074_01910 [Candidatus Aquicultor primus]